MAKTTGQKSSASKAKKAGAKPSAAAKKAKKSKLVARKNAAKTQVRLAKPKKRAKAENTASRWKEKPVGHAPHSARITAQKGPIAEVASRTKFAPKYNKDRKWLVIDAANQTVGRLASEIAMLLRGKHKPTFTPNNDAGDFVVVINCDKVKFTAAKEEAKNYFHHSGWIGGLKITTPARLRQTYPDRILFKAVRGMVPRSPLGRDQMRKLKIYAGDKHPHVSQKPVAWNLRTNTAIEEG